MALVLFLPPCNCPYFEYINVLCLVLGNLSQLETTATLNKNTDEWIIHSTTFTASKWWIGGLGAVATHALIQARIIIDGKDYGAHGFIVPIRSLKDHRPFPGVKVGDIGPKAYGGFSKIDNGCKWSSHGLGYRHAFLVVDTTNG
jgi:hypothetical protein